MDPLSLAIAAVGATKTLYKASSTIHQFVQDTRIVDSVLENLRSEFDSTARILELIKTMLRNPVHLIHARSQDHQDFLDIALASIQECCDASSEVVTKIEAISQGSASSMVSRSIRNVRYRRIQKDVLRFHTRIRDQKQNLQLLVQILLAHQSTALLEQKFLPPLSSLQLLIENASKSRTGVYVHPTNDDTSLNVIPTSLDPVKDGSLLGSSIETAHNAPEHNTQEEESFSCDTTNEEQLPDIPATSTTNIPEDRGQESESYASDIRMVQVFQAHGNSLLERRSFADAEKAFSNSLKMYEVLPVEFLPCSFVAETQLGLAIAFMYQEKWDQAEDLFTFLTQDKGNVRAKSLYHLAQIYLVKHDIDNAYTACLKARSEFQSTTGRSECTSLLVLISQTNNDETSASIYAREIQEGESSLPTALPFYRFTSKGHGLSVTQEISALEHIKSQTAAEIPLDKRPDNALAHSSSVGRLDAVKLLLWQGFPVDQASKFYGDRRALQLAALNGHIDVIETLLRHGANPDFGMVQSTHTALTYAVESRSILAVRTILKAMTPNGLEYKNAVNYAVWRNDEGVLKVLLEYEPLLKSIDRDRDHAGGNSLLSDAIKRNSVNMVRQLLAAGFEPRQEDFVKVDKSGNMELIQELRQYAERN